MSASTLLVYNKWTGHALAAVTVAAAPTGDVKAESLAGSQLPVRYVDDYRTPPDDTTVSVPADELVVLAVDSKAVPLDQARQYYVKLKDKTPAPLSTEDVTVANPSGTGFDVTFKSLSTDEIVVWVQVQQLDAGGLAGSPPIMRTARVPVTPSSAGQNVSVHVPLSSLPTGSYAALLLVPGYIPKMTTIQVPNPIP